MIWLVTKALNMSIGPQNRLFRVPFWPKRTLKCKITSPLERIFDFPAAYFDMVRASGQVLLMKATLWLPITLYGPLWPPMDPLWHHMEPYVTLCPNMGALCPALCPIQPPLGPLWHPMPLYGHIVTPIVEWLHLDNRVQIGGHRGPVE